MSAIAAPASQLVSLVYVSSSKEFLNHEEILNILRSARRNNERLGITGLLLYRDGNFLQVLEGPESAVGQIFNVIERDPRHGGVFVLYKNKIDERQFSEWSMAFRNLGELTPEEEGYSPFMKFGFLDEEFRSKPESVYKLLLRFKENVR